MAPEVITSDAWSGNGYSTAADIWSTGITAIELAQQFPPHWELKPALKALFKIPTAPAPALDVPERWSTNFTDWLELAVAKQSAHRAEAHELLSHPFVAQAGTPSQQAYLLMPVAQVGGTAVAARIGRNWRRTAVNRSARQGGARLACTYLRRAVSTHIRQREHGYSLFGTPRP